MADWTVRAVALKKKAVALERFLCARMTLSHSLRVSVVVSELDSHLDLFIKTSNEICYCDVLMSPKSLLGVRQSPAISSFSTRVSQNTCTVGTAVFRHYYLTSHCSDVLAVWRNLC